MEEEVRVRRRRGEGDPRGPLASRNSLLAKKRARPHGPEGQFRESPVSATSQMEALSSAWKGEAPQATFSAF